VSRRADPELEDKILRAAHKLWKKGGEKGLSMRKVAKEARTTTPTVYSRFKTKQEILGALLRRIQQDLKAVIDSCENPEQAGQRLLDFALNHPHEYELLYADWFGRSPASGTRVNIELMKFKLAQWLGGDPEDYNRLVLAEWALLHGAVMLIITKTVKAEVAAELRVAFHDAMLALVRSGSELLRADPVSHS
jgi:AcrR family transcriptional regulator